MPSPERFWGDMSSHAFCCASSSLQMNLMVTKFLPPLVLAVKMLRPDGAGTASLPFDPVRIAPASQMAAGCACSAPETPCAMLIFSSAPLHCLTTNPAWYINCASAEPLPSAATEDTFMLGQTSGCEGNPIASAAPCANGQGIARSMNNPITGKNCPIRRMLFMAFCTSLLFVTIQSLQHDPRTVAHAESYGGNAVKICAASQICRFTRLVIDQGCDDVARKTRRQRRIGLDALRRGRGRGRRRGTGKAAIWHCSGSGRIAIQKIDSLPCWRRALGRVQAQPQTLAIDSRSTSIYKNSRCRSC